MFKNLFRKKVKEPARESARNNKNPAAEAMKRAIEEQRKKDPLVGAKIGRK